MDRTESRAWAAPLRWASRLCALVIVAGAAAFVWQGTLSVVVADAWGFTATFVARYFADSLRFADFFVKRDSLDHAQPIQKLLLLAYTKFFDMDFGVEALTGILFGIAFVAVIVAVVRADVRGRPRAAIVTDLALLGGASIVFALNDLGEFNWSFATLSLFYPFAIAVLLVFAYRAIAADRVIELGVGMLIACALLDTSAILTGAAIVVLIALDRTRSRRDSMRLAGTVLGAILLYAIAYAFFFHVRADLSLATRASYLLQHAADSWKALVIPFGSVVLAPSRIKMLYGADAFWIWLVPSAILLWLGHAWFWREFLRRRDARLPFVAAGLMLFFYATIAGIVWGRVPRFGFDYLMQSRYLVFYMLQVVAMLMLGAAAAARENSRLALQAFIAGVVVAAGVALRFLQLGQAMLPSQIAFNRALADTIVELARDPAHVPADCSVGHLALCTWQQGPRADVLNLLRREQLNVFSPRFRARHDLAPLDADLMPSTAPAPTAP